MSSLRGFIQAGRERLFSTLKEGPVGKLVERAEEFSAEVWEAADERVRSLLEGAAAHVKQLQAEVARLQARIEELEAKVRQAADRSPPKQDSTDSSE